MKKIIKHYGIKRRSGRYPWGTGGYSQQRTSDFLGNVANYLYTNYDQDVVVATKVSKKEVKTVSLGEKLFTYNCFIES